MFTDSQVYWFMFGSWFIGLITGALAVYTQWRVRRK
jgi:hypothetical protein